MWCFLFNYCWGNVVFLVQLLLVVFHVQIVGVSCSIIVGVMWCFLFNYCWGNVVFLFNYRWGNIVFLVRLLLG